MPLPNLLPSTPRARDPLLEFKAAEHGHAVQFFETEEYLFAVVADFLASGLSHQLPVMVIATAEHRDGFLRGLQARAIDVTRVLDSGQLTLLDARETLQAFMQDGMPRKDRFADSVGKVVERLIGDRSDTVLCAYGEMVDLLWRDGNPLAAIRLEELWNGLAGRHRFSLLCAYGMQNFRNATDSDAFLEICRQHNHVVPTERYSAVDDATRLVEISTLQQRAQALENELERRLQLELDLRSALARAETGDRAKREFLSIMSHELRTPLNAIGGYAEVLQVGVHGPLTEKQRQAVDRIDQNGKHLLQLVDEVLLYAHTESGKVQFSIQPVSLHDVVRAAEVSLLPQLRAKNIDYSYVAPDDPVDALADPDRLRQILVNLLTNAIKFTDHGGRIRIECRGGVETVHVDVADTGIGIPRDKLDVIFDPFIQVDGSATRTQGGVGMGLAISRALAHGMSGDIAVTSTPGVGSVFTLTLPGCPPSNVESNDPLEVTTVSG
jgi:signal transduction histidine kinase